MVQRASGAVHSRASFHDLGAPVVGDGGAHGGRGHRDTHRLPADLQHPALGAERTVALAEVVTPAGQQRVRGSERDRGEAYDGGIFWRWTLNSVVYSVFGSVLTTFVSALTGYALAIYRFTGRRVMMGVILGSMLIPGTVVAQPTYVLLVKLGLNNTYAGLLLPALVYPFGALLCYVYAQSSIPLDLVEAARLDGAGEVRIFLSMGLRLMTTGFVTVLLFSFLGSWNSYLLPLLVLTDQNLMPLTVGLTGWNQASITIPGLQTLTIIGSLLSVIPVATVFLMLQRFWRSGLTAGGIRM